MIRWLIDHLVTAKPEQREGGPCTEAKAAIVSGLTRTASQMCMVDAASERDGLDIRRTKSVASRQSEKEANI